MANGDATAEDRAGVAFRPPVVLAAAIALSFVARAFVPLPFLGERVAASLGPWATALPFALFFWAVVSMTRGGASVPTSQPTATIVEKGPYRFSRNPIYLSMLLLQVGISVWANSLWFIVAAAVFAGLLVWSVISCEERYLERKFGADYLAYCGRVRRWL